MSVVGFDIGYYSCYIAVARQGGIETVANEYSDRCTPSFVAFTDKQRYVGTSGKNQLVSNTKNTIWGFKRLIGRKFDDPQVQAECKILPYTIVRCANEDVGIRVQYGGGNVVYTPLQITTMLLAKLKDTAEKGLSIKVVDCVISAPCFFTDAERRAMIDAAKVAGLNVLCLINDTTAVALAYGLFKQDLPAPEEPPRNVVFVDMGQSNLQVSACALNKGKLKMLATAYETIGGRDFDELLAKHFTQEFKTKYKVDAASQPRAYLRLVTECEKLKKNMSAMNTPLPISIECFMDDKDVNGTYSRADMEVLAAPLLKKVEECMRKLLQYINLTTDQIYAVEIVGGSTRIPAVKQSVVNVFGKEASTTLNADEAVARGCALQCAILSPKFVVRDFSITDCQPFGITIHWDKTSPEEENYVHVYPKFSPFPQSKALTFYKTEPFTIEVRYTAGEHLPYPSSLLGKFTINGVKPQQNGEKNKVKVKVRVDLDGLFRVYQATQVEKAEELEEPMETTSIPQEPNAVQTDKSPEAEKEQPAAEAPPTTEDKKATEKKIKVKNINLDITSHTASLSAVDINNLHESELQLAANDRLEHERLHAKNTVEEYVYEMRDKIYTQYEQYMSDEDREKFSSLLSATEEWLYGEGEDVLKQLYIDRLGELKKMGDPVVGRAKEAELRPAAFDAFAKSLVHVQKIVEKYHAGDELYNHLSNEEITKVEKILAEKRAWYDTQFDACNKARKTDNAPVLTAQIKSEREAFEKSVNPTLNKPKPKVEPPKEEKKSEAEANTNSSNNEAKNGQPQENGPRDAKEATAQPEMDVD